MDTKKMLNLGAWAAGSLSAIFLVVGIGGTAIGDYMISDKLHGDTKEKRTMLCKAQFEELAQTDPEFSYDDGDIKGCVTEKTRGFMNASNAHKTIRKTSGIGLAITLPLTIGGLALGSKK